VKRRRNILAWVGFAIVLLSFLSYVPFFALFPATRDVPWANYLLFAIGAGLLGIGLKRAFSDPEHYRGKIAGSILAALSVLMIGLFLVGVVYFSKQIPGAASALAVNQPAPPFVLADTAGRPVSSSELLKTHRGLVLVFYRGYW